jgi:hypothetical protein
MGDKKGEMAGCGTKKYENGERENTEIASRMSRHSCSRSSSRSRLHLSFASMQYGVFGENSKMGGGKKKPSHASDRPRRSEAAGPR